MAFWRVMVHVVFDTVAHRDAAQAEVLVRGGTAQTLTDNRGRPGLQADMNLALDEIKARNIRAAIRTAKTSEWIVAGTFHLHRCTHDEGSANWRDCKTLQYETG